MQQLDWLKADYPELYEEIKARVKEGRFIPIGGSWVEMDGNMPNGESFARHFLYGQAFMQREFNMTSSIFWLPDSFGYNAQIPQLMSLAGMDYFLTQKLSWSNINRFPHHSFKWQGLDGTTVTAHFPPSDTYTSGASVGDVRKSESEYRNSDVSKESMLVFGHGDGGGGPTAAMASRLELLSDVQGLPKVKMANPEDFFKKLASRDLPTWEGELYLELHRGTLTSQGKIKYYNRKCEGLLRESELISCVCALITKDDPYPAFTYPKAELERLWKLVLLNQFHDVLPGSSIETVYRDASKIYQSVEYEASKLRELAIRALFGLRTKTETMSLHQGGQQKADLKSGLYFSTRSPLPGRRLSLSRSIRTRTGRE